VKLEADVAATEVAATEVAATEVAAAEVAALEVAAAEVAVAEVAEVAATDVAAAEVAVAEDAVAEVAEVAEAPLVGVGRVGSNIQRSFIREVVAAYASPQKYHSLPLTSVKDTPSDLAPGVVAVPAIPLVP